MIGILWLFLQSAASHLLYLALRLETGSFPKPLSAKEEQAAFAAMRAGDAAARETLICHNLRLVAHIVKKYYTVSGGQDDFISIGTIGLIKAVDTYDCTRTTRFASYASRCIENELRMQLRHTRHEAGTVSLQEPLETGADSGMLTLADVLPDLATMEEDCELRDAAAQLRQLVTALPEREQQILTLRYGLNGAVPQTQQQIAAQFGISRSYVSRLEKHALARLRRAWNQPHPLKLLKRLHFITAVHRRTTVSVKVKSMTFQNYLHCPLLFLYNNIYTCVCAAAGASIKLMGL